MEADRGKLMFDAAQRGQYYRLRDLLDGAQKGDIEWKSGSCETALFVASAFGHQSCVKLLLEAGAEVDSDDCIGWTPLRISSNCGHLEVVKLLLLAGARVDLTTDRGWTPLMSSSYMGHSEVVKLLLDAGADKKLKDTNGETAFEMANRQQIGAVLAVYREHEYVELEDRPAVVASAGRALPLELAELCGDFVALTPERREIERRHKQQN